jgi:hypothetical protein
MIPPFAEPRPATPASDDLAVRGEAIRDFLRFASANGVGLMAGRYEEHWPHGIMCESEYRTVYRCVENEERLIARFLGIDWAAVETERAAVAAWESLRDAFARADALGEVP